MEYIKEVEDSLEDKSKQSRGWMITINNPFGTDIIEVDISKTDLPIQEDYYDKDLMKDFEESDLFNFKYIKIQKREDDFSVNEFIIKRPFFKNASCVQQYFESLESFQYCIFQIERGEECATEHIQAFLMFRGGKRFRTVHSLLPFAHIEPKIGTTVQCREYCSKKDTRVDGPYESGQFANERNKVAEHEFIELVKSGVSRQELQKLNPSLYLKHLKNIDSIYLSQFECYKYLCRDVDVTYIYGPPGSGKSKYIRHIVDLKKSFLVDTYDISAFSKYRGEETLILDEYVDFFKIQTLNKMLDVNPFKLRGLGTLEYACYKHVYIISNYSPKEIYKSEQTAYNNVYQAFNRRLHRILKFNNDKFTVIRDTEWEDCTDEKDKELGLTKQIKCTYEFDSAGNKIYLYNRYSTQDMELIEVEDDFSIFDNEGQIKF